jgi:RNA ligase (TIGR02306 family)
MSSLIVEVCEIKSVEAHPNADRLDIATVKGWNCIVQKGSYSIGDWCVFFPPDSILPDWIIEEYELEFLKKGGRVGTLKLRGYISQGLILPPTVLAKSGGYHFVGDDVTKVLGVTKYEVPEKPIHMQGKSTTRKVQNPNFTKYTDIENIQNFDTVFQDGDIVVITEKIHGSNIRFGWLPIEINWKNGNVFGILRSLFRKYILRDKYEFVYGSHNVQLQFDRDKGFYAENIYAKVLKNYNTSDLPKGYTFYGEVYGKGVQELEYGCSDLRLVIFDVKDSKDNHYVNWHTLTMVCEQYGFPTVPLLYEGWFDLRTLKNCTEGYSSIDSTQIKEGCVVKPILETNHPRIGRMILKSINPEYLARKNRTEFH